MIEEDYNNYFEILELPPDASLSEIRRSYQYLKELYSVESIVTLPVEEDVSEERKIEILQQIEEAYNRLSDLFEKEKNKGHGGKTRLIDKDIDEFISSITTFSGQALKQIREKIGIDLYDISLETKIRIRYLEDMELEKYDSLPPAVYLRGYICNYASYLSLDPKKVADDYMNRYYEWKSGREKR
ncbi:MAG: helix-turn-helix domain-containing protein [Nitrospirota bacterium]